MAKAAKKGRKFGRNAAFCLAYRNNNTREINKLRKIMKHLRKHVNDLSQIKALTHISKTARIKWAVRAEELLSALSTQPHLRPPKMEAALRPL